MNGGPKKHRRIALAIREERGGELSIFFIATFLTLVMVTKPMSYPESI